jgi:autotransporter-associated beta strand protein
VPLTIDVANGAAADDLVISGNISQAVPGAGLTKTGTGTLELTGASANTYTGLTSVNDGTLRLNKTAGLDAFGGNLVIGDTVGSMGSAVVQLLSANQIPNGSTITINSDGVLDLAGNDETVGPLTLASGQVDGSVGSDTLTLAGTLSSSGTSSVGGANDTLDVNGNDVNVTGGTLTVTRTIEDGAGNQLVKNGAGTLEIAGGATLGGPGVDGIVNNAGTTTITSGTVDLGGSNVSTPAASFSLDGGILQNVDTIFGTLDQTGGTLINTVNSPPTR